MRMAFFATSHKKFRTLYGTWSFQISDHITSLSSHVSLHWSSKVDLMVNLQKDASSQNIWSFISIYVGVYIPANNMLVSIYLPMTKECNYKTYHLKSTTSNNLMSHIVCHFVVRFYVINMTNKTLNKWPISSPNIQPDLCLILVGNTSFYYFQHKRSYFTHKFYMNHRLIVYILWSYNFNPWNVFVNSHVWVKFHNETIICFMQLFNTEPSSLLRLTKLTWQDSHLSP